MGYICKSEAVCCPADTTYMVKLAGGEVTLLCSGELHLYIKLSIF